MKQALLAILATPLAFAAPFQPALIPAETQWFLHGDLTGLRATTTGGILIKELREKEAEQIANVENLFGFDLLSDLTDVTLFGSGKADEAAIVLSGKFDRSHLETLIQEAENYQAKAHRSTVIHQWDDNGITQQAAFHNDQTLIISQQIELLTLGLDVLSGKKPGLDANLPLPSKNPVIVAFANVKEIEMPLNDGSRIVRKADSILITLGETDDRLVADMIVKTSTEKTAQRIMHVLEGLVSLGELADDTIEDLDVRHTGETTGKTMTMTMSLPTTKALALLKELD